MSTTKRRPARRVGMIFTLDFQADVWQGQYKLIRRVSPNRWEVEYLPDPPETATRIREFWAAEKARGGMTDPIWDKTWAECRDGERPERIGQLTHEQMAEAEIARRAANAGRRTEVTFISAARYAEYF